MAEYIKFRLTAAKVGVSMAFMALLAGIAERVHASPPETRAIPAAQFLNLNNFSGATRATFAKIEKKLLKADSAILKLQSTLNHKYLKITDANQKYLKITDANAEFLKIGQTAANSALLGNLRPDQFFQGNGHVVTGALPAVQSQGTQQLLALPDGTLSVLIGLLRGQQPQVTIHNNTSDTLSGILEEGGSGGTDTTNTIALKPGDNALAFTMPAGGGGQLHLQIFPSGQSFSEVVSILVSLDTVNGAPSAVGQAFTGGV
jgi:hypothetical protein